MIASVQDHAIAPDQGRKDLAHAPNPPGPIGTTTRRKIVTKVRTRISAVRIKRIEVEARREKRRGAGVRVRTERRLRKTKMAKVRIRRKRKLIVRLRGR